MIIIENVGCTLCMVGWRRGRFGRTNMELHLADATPLIFVNIIIVTIINIVDVPLRVQIKCFDEIDLYISITTALWNMSSALIFARCPQFETFKTSKVQLARLHRDCSSQKEHIVVWYNLRIGRRQCHLGWHGTLPMLSSGLTLTVESDIAGKELAPPLLWSVL